MKIKISFLLLILVLISCQKREIPENKFIGTWYDTEYIVPNRTILKINKDSTFDYQSGACTWRGFSRGKWKMVGDSIELLSRKIDTCYQIFPFTNCEYFKETMTIPNCTEVSDVSFVLLSNEVFYIKKDSLVYKLKRGSNCPDSLKIVFARTQKIRR